MNHQLRHSEQFTAAPLFICLQGKSIVYLLIVELYNTVMFNYLNKSDWPEGIDSFSITDCKVYILMHSFYKVGLFILQHEQSLIIKIFFNRENSFFLEVFI